MLRTDLGCISLNFSSLTPHHSSLAFCYNILMYERHNSPLLHRRLFIRRLLFSFLTGVAIIVFSLAIGMLGYHSFEGMGWIDAFVNAAMILAGMGPFSPLDNEGAKIFAGFYALYSGIALVTTLAVIFAPIVHRFLHRFHLEETKDSED